MSEKRKLTINDPVDPETIAHLDMIQRKRAQLGDRLLDLEQEKVAILRAASRLNAEQLKIFEEINVSRGLPPQAPVQINAKTGQVILLNDGVGAPEVAPEVRAADQANQEKVSGQSGE